MEKRTLLISLRSPFLDSDRIYPALANLYLKSAMEEQGLDTTITDESFRETLKDYSHIGVSIMTPQRALARDFVHWAKEMSPNSVLIAGGPHANYYTSDLISEPWDHIVKGDGERVLPRIVQGKEKNRLVEDRLSRQELAAMPRPARVACKDYLKGYNYVLKGRDSTTMLTARGCPERCTFCEDAMTAVNRTPLDKVKLELDDIVELGYKGVYIFDDIFALAPKVTEPICRELKERDLIYRCNGQARMMSEPFMKMFSETGCAEIAFGAESGSQKILDNIQKRTTIDQNYNFVRWASEYGIPLKLFILLGLPGEDRKTLEETEDFIRYARQLNSETDVQVAVYYPYKGTQIRDAIDKGGLVDLTFKGEGLGAYGQKGGESEYVVGTRDLTPQDLKQFRDHLIETYRPKSHSKHKLAQRKEEDNFFNPEFHISGVRK